MRLLGFIACAGIMVWILDFAAGIAAFFDPISFAVVLWEDWHSPRLKGA